MSDNKRKFILMSDSTCDLPAELYSQLGVKILKLSFEIDGHTHSDGDMDYHEFYDMMRNGSLSISNDQLPNVTTRPGEQSPCLTFFSRPPMRSP